MTKRQLEIYNFIEKKKHYNYLIKVNGVSHKKLH